MTGLACGLSKARCPRLLEFLVRKKSRHSHLMIGQPERLRRTNPAAYSADVNASFARPSMTMWKTKMVAVLAKIT